MPSVKRELISARPTRYFTRNAKLAKPDEPNKCLATFRNYLAAAKIKGRNARPRNSSTNGIACVYQMKTVRRIATKTTLCIAIIYIQNA